MVNDFILEGKELYKDEKMRIHKSVYGTDEHDVVIGKNYIFLNRGIMSEWVNDSVTEIELNYLELKGINYELENPSVPIEEFRWALSMARIRELEDMLSR